MSSSSLHFLVFGATGSCGLLFVHAALNDGHRLTLLARSPSKIPDDVSSHERVDVIEGSLDDHDVCARAAQCGADVFVSLAGPSAKMGNVGTPLTDGLKTLLPLLSQHNIRRILILSTPSFRSPEDSSSIFWSSAAWAIYALSPGAYKEIVGMGDFVSHLNSNDVQWTLYRVGFLTNGAAKEVRETYIGTGEDGGFISRESVAQWVLKEAKEGKWIGKTPYICNKYAERIFPPGLQQLVHMYETRVG